MRLREAGVGDPHRHSRHYGIRMESALQRRAGCSRSEGREQESAAATMPCQLGHRATRPPSCCARTVREGPTTPDCGLPFPVPPARPARSRGQAGGMLDVGTVSIALKIASHFEKFIVQSPICLYIYKSHFWRSQRQVIRDNTVAGRCTWARPCLGLGRAGLRGRS